MGFILQPWYLMVYELRSAQVAAGQSLRVLQDRLAVTEQKMTRTVQGYQQAEDDTLKVIHASLLADGNMTVTGKIQWQKEESQAYPGTGLYGLTKGSSQSGWLSGTGAFSDAAKLGMDIRNGPWDLAVFAFARSILDGLQVWFDPASALVGSLIGWILQHVTIIRDSINEITGWPSVLKDMASGWSTIAKDLTTLADEYEQAVNADTVKWTGAAADAYRATANDIHGQIRACSGLADAAGALLDVAAQISSGLHYLLRVVLKQFLKALASAITAALTDGVDVVADFDAVDEAGKAVMTLIKTLRMLVHDGKEFVTVARLYLKLATYIDKAGHAISKA